MPADLKLLQPVQLGDLSLKNAVFMAPLTRARAGHDRIPKELNVKYYTQRASMGLIISEGTSFTDEAHGWSQSAALTTDATIKGWKAVTDAVHDQGSVIFCQLWHTGRASHSSFKPDKSLPVAPSAIAITGDDGVHALDDEGNDIKVPHEVPRALETDEIPRLVQDYVTAAKHAKEAGFDGVEIHSANGYLLDTFLQTSTNTRTDEYGGSLENRFRVHRQVIEAISDVFPKNRIGIRFSPNGVFNGMGSEDNIETFTYAIGECEKLGVGYVHVMDGLGFGYHEKCRPFTLADARAVYKGFIIGNVGYTRDSAEEAIQAGNANAIAFGRPTLANPDLVARFANDWPLAEAPFSAWYSHDEDGYTTWPTYEEQQEKEKAAL